MSNKDLNITEENELSITIQDDDKKIILVKYPDGTMEIAVEDFEDQKNIDLSKQQKEYLINWLKTE